MAASIGISILGYNSLKHLPDCLGSLMASLKDFAPGEVEVLFWDNASIDGSADWVRLNFPQVKILVSEKNLGFSQGNNNAYEALAPRQYFVMLNDDTVVEPGWLKELIKAAQASPRVMIVQSLILLWPDKNLINSLGNYIHFLGFGYAGGNKLPLERAADFVKQIRPITSASGAAMLIKTELLKETKLFYENFFMYHEDLDLGWRARLLGYQTVLAPASIVYHKYQFKKSIAKYFYMERNRLLAMGQNYHLLTLILIAPAFFLMELGMLGYSFFTGWYREKFRVYRYFLRIDNWKNLLVNRRQVQKTRRVSEREVVNDFVGKIEFQDLRNPVLIYLANPLMNLYWRAIKFFIVW